MALTFFAVFLTPFLNNENRAKLIWGKELYIDATRVDANASLDSLTTRFAVGGRVANSRT